MVIAAGDEQRRLHFDFLFRQQFGEPLAHGLRHAGGRLHNVVVMLGEHLRKAFRGLLLPGKGVRRDAVLLANRDRFFPSLMPWIPSAARRESKNTGMILLSSLT